MRHLVRWSVLIALTSIAPVAYGDDDKDQKSIEGTWRFVSLESDGEKAPAGIFEKWRWVIKGTEVSIGDPSQGDPAEGGQKASFKIDSTTKPKALDMTALDGKKKGKLLEGIYELDGDHLKICVPEGKQEKPNPERPKAFDGGQGKSLIVLERVKDNPK